MAGQAQPCVQCGASGRLGTCDELFHALLALDHQRLQPWGRYHGLNVACFGLQHPSGITAKVLDGQLAMLTAFLVGGLDAVNAREAEQVRANRRGGLMRADAAAVVPPSSAPVVLVTIEDVAVDGTFPAEGYQQRMHAWARSIAGERP
ncbi:DUF5946 family protein [Pseudactinotalea terrae]|uniref:DUF5946 family protein n=1 Tax=Pseudactinotalea terrae TaxID=1743262 RepID=UPI0012E138F4|nr:DUF5946 family protein [Pseudactinotalea terrae]